MPDPASEPLVYDLLDEALRVTLHERDARVHALPEALVQDLWAGQRFEAAGLVTTDGEPVEVLAPGVHNTDGGPDFSEARLRIHPEAGAPLVWTGDVEVHRTSGEWLEHRHDQDPAYDRVVLHVCLLGDRHTGTLLRSDGTRLPEVHLYPLLRDSLRSLLYDFYLRPGADLPCGHVLPTAPEGLVRRLARAQGVARLREQAARWVHLPTDEALYQATARAMGYAKNAEPMQRLADRVPLKRLRQQASQQDREAVLLAASGLLPGRDVERQLDAASQAFLAAVRDRDPGPSPMRAEAWQHFRLRPASFPARRIAQLAALAAPEAWLGEGDPLQALKAALCATRPLRALRRLLVQPRPSPYWETHARLDRPTAAKPTSPSIGRSRADRVLLNAVLPLLLDRLDGRTEAEARAGLDRVLDRLPFASDEVTRRFEAHGVAPASGLEAHGLHRLFRTGCQPGRCLECPVGQHALGGA